MIYRIYMYDDPHRGWGDIGTVAYVEAETRAEALEGFESYAHGAEEISTEEAMARIEVHEERIEHNKTLQEQLVNLTLPF